MAHINKLIDFTVVVYIVLQNKVLLVNHKKLKKWLPLGGHIELDEDPEEAAIREAKEESGFDIEIIADKPKIKDKFNKLLFRPEYLDIHKVGGEHRHVGIVYFARVKSGELKLAEAEHNDIGWFSLKDLESKKLNLGPAIKFYAEKALAKLSS
jgi:8-oxo-dGTP pyrophosphatase MutT (NUDIX family)